jgi:predicted RNase H-like HicB family nuclease
MTMAFLSPKFLLFRGCISQGQTRVEATENIKEAIVLYLESLSAHDEAIPPPITEELVEVNA